MQLFIFGSSETSRIRNSVSVWSDYVEARKGKGTKAHHKTHMKTARRNSRAHKVGCKCKPDSLRLSDKDQIKQAEIGNIPACTHTARLASDQ
jgi:hypothetical protein